VGRLFTFNALQVAALGSYTPTGSLEGSGIVVGEGAFAIEVGGLKASGSPYYFMVTELDESGNGWTYDSHSFWVEVTVAVADNESLSVEVTQTSGGTAFENVYHRTPGSTDLVLTGTKRATGRALADGQFEFAVFEGEAVVAHATNAASGHIRFSPIVYTEAGAHTYTVRETSMPGGGWTTDGAAYTVIVVVVDNKDGTLTATAAYPAGGLAFVNAYSQPTGGADKLPPLGDASAVVLLLLLGSAAACLCGHLAGRRRGRPIGSHSRL
jgi:pilin isopeptide linkage protein